MFKVYQAKHVPTGKIYIGVTRVPLLKRVGQHLGLTEYKQGKFQQFLHTTQYSEWDWTVLVEIADQKQAYDTEAAMIKDARSQGLGLLNSEEGRNYKNRGTKLEWLADHQFKAGQEAWNKGKQGVSGHTREKMRVSRLRKPVRYVPDEVDAQRMRELYGKKIICNETTQEFDSISQAATALGLQRGNIRKVLQGKQTYAKGFSFRYLEKKD